MRHTEGAGAKLIGSSSATRRCETEIGARTSDGASAVDLC
jgi:hypothetical protein